MNETDYGRGLYELEQLNHRLETAHFDYEAEMALAIQNCPSNLDAYDLVYSITIGVLGAILGTNEKIAEFLDEVHQLASMEHIESDSKLKELLAKLLHHQGDWMDKVPTDKVGKSGNNLKSYVSRYSQYSDGVWSSDVKITGPHRIFWGHDIFSIKGDNPFALLIQQYGVGKGIIQAIRHLVADTCSRQGLVMPGSSFFDYIEVSTDESGETVKKARNKLLDFCQQYSREALGKGQAGFDNEIFNHLFSIHMQDILSSGLVAASVTVYSKGRKITDETRKVQMRVIGYMGTAFGSAIIGAAKYGVPYINWPSFFALVKNIMQMIHITNKEIQAIMVETELLITERKALERRERNLHNELVADLHEVLISHDRNAVRNSLIDFLGEVN